MNRVLEIPMSVQEVDNINMTLSEDGPISMELETVTPGGGGGGTNDYEQLIHKPSINTHVLVGDSNFEDIGLHFMTNVELQQLLGG
ncbi:MAG: hypothetical protein J6Y02_02730 [Pseudobutyrivibrio sp.]|nr:hypothetical protein [Pseudobutyrivibrio sp.]